MLLVSERFFSSYIKLPSNLFVNSLKALVVFSLVTLGWLLFKLPEFSHVLSYLNSILSNAGPHNKGVMMMIFFYSLPMFPYYANYVVSQKTNKNYLDNSFVYAILLFLIVTSSGSSGEFIYFQF